MIPTIIQKPILHINSEELPHMYKEDILGEKYYDSEYEEIYKRDSVYFNDPIKIDTLRKYLDELESKGANYVAIDFHEDHQELELDGVFIGLATQEEIDEHNEEQRLLKVATLENNIGVLKKKVEADEATLRKLKGED